MPKHWLYYIALIVPLVARGIIYHTSFVESFWYSGNHDVYYALSALRVNHLFVEFIGGWALPAFIILIGAYWHADIHTDHDTQFLLLPLYYVPITIIVNIASNRALDPAILYVHPLVVIPLGYIYVLTWVACIKLFEKLRIVV